MSRAITTAHVAVQVETDRTDVWVPEGLAVRKLPYTATDTLTYTYDARNGFALTGTRAGLGKDAGTITETDTAGWVCTVPKLYSVEKPNTIGPPLVHTKLPIPVTPGMEVAFSGTFKARKTGENATQKDGTGTTATYVEAVLWGLGESVDEYGKTTQVKRKLRQFSSLLQSVNDTSKSMVQFTIGDPNAPVWATVPADVDRLHFSIHLTLNSVNSFKQISATYKFTYDRETARYFRSPPIASTTDNPLRVHLRDPNNTNPTYEHPLSTTGYAFRNRALFTNITPGVEIIALPDTGATGDTVIDVYNWTGARDLLLTSITVPPGQRVVTPIAHTGAIELSSSSTFYIESVLAPVYESDTVEQTRLHRYEYTTVTDPVSDIGTTLREADLSTSTVRFVSDTISPLVAAGKRLRIAGRAGGQLIPMVTGTIRTRRLVAAPGRTRQVEIGVHDDWARLAEEYPSTFDRLPEYGPVLHRLGIPAVVDGVDYTGPPGALPASFGYGPSYQNDGQELRESLLTVRNTTAGYLFTDRRGRLILTTTLPGTVALDVSDVPTEGDMSYSKQLEIITDSESLINVVAVTEHLLDRDDYINRVIDNADAPQSGLDPINSLTRTIRYRDADSVEAYGQSVLELDVVRGTGDLADVVDGNFGQSFQARAEDILSTYGVERDDIAKIILPVLTPAHIPQLAQLQPFDAVVIRHQGQARVGRPRIVKHTINPRGWSCELDFTVRRDQVYWLPPDPQIPETPVFGGYYHLPLPGAFDGGSPDSTGVGTIDGEDQ